MRITDISINKRLWLAVLLPLAAMAYLATLQVSSMWSSYRQMNDIAAVSDNIAVIGNTVHSLQVERGLSAGFIASGGKIGGSELSAARGKTDAALGAFRNLSQAIIGFHDDALDSRLKGLEERIANLATARRSIDGLGFTSQQSFITFTTFVGDLSGLASDLSMRGVGSGIAAEMIAYNQLMQAKEIAGQERATGTGFIAAGKLDTSRIADFTHMAGAQNALLQNFLALQETSRRASYTEALNVPALAEVEAVRRKIATEGANADLSGFDSQTWFKATTQRIEAMKEMEDRSLQALGALAQADAAHAMNGLESVLILCVGGGIVMVALSSFMAMTIVRPLRKLVDRMGTLAAGNLEASQDSADRKDEIGDMARAVEVFRQGAIRNRELETEAEDTRRRAEVERIETQRQAEAAAEERLNRATGSLANGLQRLAGGDMLCEIDEAFAPQFEALRRDFNHSVSQLRQTLESVGHSVLTVNSGAGEISGASDDLARRTEQQAASLEQTAAALEEITVNVSATSRRSNDAREVTRRAHAQAGKSGGIVRDAVTAMARIDHASRQISQIIGVIDEIAFQTNLLALNAGVEAARAGDAGKGFAVVAQEVRELAQRSAGAAREIKDLIGNSEVAVAEGVRLVSDTGKGLEDIVQLVEQVNAHMDAIATAAQEQSAGLAEVNTAVNHMDQATQHNAAMVEEMNAAGAGLAQESSTLQRLLSSFRLQGETGQRTFAAEPQRRRA